MVCDFSDMYFTTIDISKSASCSVCQSTETPRKQTEKLVWLCGRETANINPKKPLNINLNELVKQVKTIFKLRLKSNLAIIFDYNGLEVSLFRGGRMLIKNVDNEKTALDAYRNILEKLKLNNR